MSNVRVRDVSEDDFERIVELNLAEVAHTSTMDKEDVARLHSISVYHRMILVDGCTAGFLLAMGPTSQYINENYTWFKNHYASYIYIDRIVLAAQYQGMGIGIILYKDLFTWAKEQGINHVVCEYNVVPPNLPSAKFHQSLGFNEIGYQWLPLSKNTYSQKRDNDQVNTRTHKKVSMQSIDLSLT